MADTLVRTLAEWKQFFKENGEPADIIELMEQENSILEDIKFMMANGKEVHQTPIRNGLPTVTWGRLYKGIPVSKSSVTMVKDAMGFIEGRSEIDSRMKELWKDRFKSYRLSESKTFAESMRQKLATTIFYGDTATNPDGFMGLDPRYAFSDSPNVIDAGGSGSACTSMWGIVWGEDATYGIFPLDSQAGMDHQDKGEQKATDANGDSYYVYEDIYRQYCGLTVQDWRCVVRVCNIDTTKLDLEKGDTGFIDLQRLTIKAKNKIPSAKRGRMIWYCNEDVLTALELQATDAGNVQLRYGELFNSKEIPYIHGKPVRECEAILSTEEALTAKL